MGRSLWTTVSQLPIPKTLQDMIKLSGYLEDEIEFTISSPSWRRLSFSVFDHRDLFEFDHDFVFFSLLRSLIRLHSPITSRAAGDAGLKVHISALSSVTGNNFHIIRLGA
jgi:hypothetical protein